MRLELTYVEDNFRRSVLCKDADLKAGEIAMVKGLADPKYNTGDFAVALDGETYEVVDNQDKAEEMFVVVAPDGHRHKKEDMWNHGDYADTPMGEAVRAYILHVGMVLDVEVAAAIDGEVAVGDILGVKAGEKKLAKDAGATAGKFAKVLKKYKEDKIDMVRIVITR